MKKTTEHLFSVICALTIGFGVSALRAVPVAAQCDYYASPDGTGNGLSQSSPFRVSDFWAVAVPGKTLCLFDGEYTGYDSTIRPPAGLNGIADKPITISALNDGKATINGQNKWPPVYLQKNDYFIIKGINCCNGGVILTNSNHNIIRRVCAWDAGLSANTEIFGIHYGEYNLIEDCAGWGTARKIYQSSYGGNHTTLRRCWGRWEGSTCVGPKMTYTIAYDNANMILENCIGTWSGEKMPASYTLMSNNGKSYEGWTYNYRHGKWVSTYVTAPVIYTNYEVEHPRSIFGNDDTTNKHPYAQMFGCLAYIQATDIFAPNALIFLQEMDTFNVVNTVAAIEPGTHLTKYPFFLLTMGTGGIPAPGVVHNLTVSHLTSLGGTTSYFQTMWGGRAQWIVTDAVQASSIAALGSSPYDGSQGATLCYRYVNGQLTNQPLWPWPMNERIKSAMLQSGRNPVDVTRTVEALLGSIPGKCGGS